MGAQDFSVFEIDRSNAFISCYYDLQKITLLG